MNGHLMHTELLEGNDAGVARAAELLAAGQVVAFPTETVYGLGGDATSTQAVAKIYEAKGRPSHNPLIVHVAAIAEARELAASWTDAAERLARAFWPGPLTLVLDSSGMVCPAALAGGHTVGIRIPDHPLSGRLLRRVKRPIAAPSANSSGRVSPTEARHVMADLNGRIAAILDGGPCLGGIESTVVDVTRPGRVVILRPGLITMPELASALQGAADIMRHEARVDSPVATSDGALRSPGLLERHYAPAIPLRIIEDCVELDAAEGQRVARIYIGGAGLTQASLADGVFVIPAHPDGAASQLYRVLRDAENLPVNEILIEAPPTGVVWDAIRDRLKRAATPAPPK